MVVHGKTVVRSPRPERVHTYSYIQNTINITERTFVNKIRNNRRTMYIQPVNRINLVMDSPRENRVVVGQQEFHKRYDNEQEWNAADGWKDRPGENIPAEDATQADSKAFYVANGASPDTIYDGPVQP